MVQGFSGFQGLDPRRAEESSLPFLSPPLFRTLTGQQRRELFTAVNNHFTLLTLLSRLLSFSRSLFSSLLFSSSLLSSPQQRQYSESPLTVSSCSETGLSNHWAEKREDREERLITPLVTYCRMPLTFS
jgi:hypothetical protein